MESPKQRPSRVFVTGNAGSGKTTLARQIGSILSLPCYGLDQIVWKAGWGKPTLAERNAALTELAMRPMWVIDGVSRIIEAHADFVIFLDVSPFICTWRCAKRNWRYLFRSRPELPPQCPEWMIIPELLKIIWRFNRAARQGILERAAHPQSGQSYTCLLSKEDRADLIASLYEHASLAVHISNKSV